MGIVLSYHLVIKRVAVIEFTCTTKALLLEIFRPPYSLFHIGNLQIVYFSNIAQPRIFMVYGNN